MAQNQEMNPAMAQALQRLEAGQPAEAEAIVAQAVEQARRQEGVDSPAYASAQNDLGTILMMTGQTALAIDAFRAACQYEFPDDEWATRERLTFLLNLGTVLERADRLEESVEAFHQGLREREQFYGREHPGYAFGLLPLCDALLKQRNLTDALTAIEETIENFQHNAHPLIVRAIAIRAEIVKSQDSTMFVLAESSSLTDAQMVELTETILSRCAQEGSQAQRAVLDDLLANLSDRFGDTDLWTINTLTTMANLDRATGNHTSREWAIRRVLGAYDSMGDQIQALHAVEGLALALGEAGDMKRAEAVHREALERAESMDESIRSKVNRNFGLFLSEQGKLNEAETILRHSVELAKQTTEAELRGLAEIALGIFLQHQSKLEEAECLLRDAITLVDSAHPHALMGRSHLQAIETGSKCGCGDMSHAAAEAFCDYFREQLPEDLLEDVHVEIDEGELKIQVQLIREPTREELALLSRIQRHAQHQFQERLRRQS